MFFSNICLSLKVFADNIAPSIPLNTNNDKSFILEVINSLFSTAFFRISSIILFKHNYLFFNKISNSSSLFDISCIKFAKGQPLGENSYILINIFSKFSKYGVSPSNISLYF